MLPAHRPRERITATGVKSLSDQELIAVLLGTGARGRDVLQVSSDVLKLIDLHGPTLPPDTLTKIRGVGKAKAATISAAMEFARRRIRPIGLKISEAKDVVPLVSHLADRPQEHFICISLNGAHEVIATRIVTIGLVNSSQVHPREVFSDPLMDRAIAVIVCHNHPSGNLSPSSEDRRTTKSLTEAGSILGIRVLDHVIFGVNGFYSFADHGEI